jgi:diguanylate cyclase (GGDEF)-like protein
MQQTRQGDQGDATSLHASQYRRAGVFLAGMLALLAGTAAYVVFHDRAEIWHSAHENAENIALGLESASGVLLEQPVVSLRGIGKDLAGTGTVREGTFDVLRNAMRYDPVSVYLGVQGADGSMAVVGRDGKPVGAALAQALRSRVVRPRADGFDVQQLVQLPSGTEWYVPVTLNGPGSGTDRAFGFSLVSARHMAAGAESLRLLPDSYVAFVAADGRRLLRYRQGEASLEVNGPPLPPQRLQVMHAHGAGSFEMSNSITGAPQIAGYARSSVLPVYVAAIVPTHGLYEQWARESVGPVLVLLMGIAGVVVFAVQLRASLIRQAQFLAKEQYRADHDMLTQLLNRDAFMHRVDDEIAAAPRQPFTVVLMDVCNFKDINDTLGHANGDEVLKITGRRLLKELGDDGVLVARVAGDELCVFARGVHTPQALEALRLRLQACLGEPFVLGGVELELAASMGAAVFPDDARTASELLRCADIAVSAGKSDLRPFTRYSELLDQFSPELLTLKAEFAKALREKTLSVVYQPKVRLTDGALVGVEALARWDHPTRGLVSPGRFIPLAENSELIHPFTHFILESALEQAARWHAMGQVVPVAVNISANNLLDHTFTDRVGELLERFAVPSHLLELEVTESAVMRHPESVVKRLRALRDLGVRLSIDDFGTGYASLTYLKQLPVHSLKIDMSFVVNMEHDEADQRIVRSSTQLGHGFGMSVVAEGVETASAAALLAEYGCEFAQGYYFAKPMNAEELQTHWLARAAATRDDRKAPTGVA